MKEDYKAIEMEVIHFNSEDIITGSNDTPPIMDDDED